MKIITIWLLLLISVNTRAQIAINEKDVNFDLRIVADKLSDPWSVAIAPDQYHFDGTQQNNDGGEPNSGGYFYKIRIVRYSYDQVSAKLITPVIICDSIPGSSDHNGGRLGNRIC
ncbi:hypothetical protein [Pedobacter hartonius]|uniref:Uncharacterized protein n=1 Tax=Pedobacter hartonius TaxID=425514 RepID=A0A1H3W324_9SPHI|nr:hypothetical protein [Pedobacter hartonius]SDZ80712.1 hypothetical protein SAMN05443550_10149 [Pedobacter hartonius]